MCGFYVYISEQTIRQEFLESKIKEALACLETRGPDDFKVLLLTQEKGREGWSFVDYEEFGKFKLDVSVCGLLVHRRLSIIDESDNGKQPSIGDDSILIFNGTIYNHQYLLAEYVPDAVPDDSDTKNLHKILDIGGSPFSRINGKFAIIYIKLSSKKIVVSRDKFGAKPIYECNTKGIYELTSDIRLLHKGRKINHAYIYRSIFKAAGRWELDTEYCGIQNVIPGVVRILNGNDFNDYIIENFQLTSRNVRLSSDHFKLDRLTDLVKNAILSRTIGDRKVCVALSGGLDSTIIASVLRKDAYQDLDAFTVVFVEGGKSIGGFDSINARMTADEIGINLIECKVDIENYFEYYRSRALERNRTGVNPSVQGMALYSQPRAYGYKVILDGQGADELFGGYDSFSPSIGNRIFSLFQLAIQPAKQLVRQDKNILLPNIRKEPYHYKREKFVALREPPCISLTQKFHRAFDREFRQLVWEVDFDSMAYSLESRQPYLDRDLVDYVRSLPSKIKINKSRRKYILAHAMRDYIPKHIYSERRKEGFPGMDKYVFSNNISGAFDKAYSIIKSIYIRYDNAKAVDYIKLKYIAEKNFDYFDRILVTAIFLDNNSHINNSLEE